jgi:hypothetical protein
MCEALFFINVMTEMGEEHLSVINNELMPQHMFVNYYPRPKNKPLTYCSLRNNSRYGLGSWNIKPHKNTSTIKNTVLKSGDIYG